MPSRKQTKPVKQPGQIIVNPKASTVPTSTPTPFAPVPDMEPARPVTAPRLRQISESENVKIIGKRTEV